MSLIRDDGDERQTRVDRMIDEFRAAQLRRVAQAAAARPDARPQPDGDAQAAVVPFTDNTAHTVK